tara:strand:+ start:68 stop:451 length:384 start_codon:yes stop_codon:yes gene_type:complete
VKKRTAFIGAILSLIPLGQPLIIKTGIVLSTTGFMLYVPEKAIAGDIWFYLDRADSKGSSGDWYGAISEFNKALKTNSSRKDLIALSYFGRGAAKEQIRDMKGACSDWRKALSLGADYAKKYVQKKC